MEKTVSGLREEGLLGKQEKRRYAQQQKETASSAVNTIELQMEEHACIGGANKRRKNKTLQKKGKRY